MSDDKKKDLPPPSFSKAPSAPKEPEIVSENPKPAEPSGSIPSANEPVSVTPAADKPKTVAPAPEKTDGSDELAALNSRILAGVIDAFVAAGLMLTVQWIMPFMEDFLGWVVYGAYWIGRDSFPFLKGQSIGKLAMKTQVVNAEGKPIVGDWKTGAIRNAALLIPFFGVVELIILVSRDSNEDRGYRLGDEWAKTKVVNAPKPIEISQD